MKLKVILFLFIQCSFYHIQAQQWVQKQYSYDSLLNIEYGIAVDFNGDADTLHMDVYLPKCDNSSKTSIRPLMIFIHGGAFLTGNRNESSIQSLCKSFAQRGYVTASIDYRLGFVADDQAWQCNFPDYSCAFAADSAEWVRAYYRSIQDAKGALRFLINQNKLYKIDVNNVFVAGESAGAFTALGVALMDTEVERPQCTYQLSDVPLPHVNARKCIYNDKKVFKSNRIIRPDLGGIDGNIQPTSIKYTIKGVGNMFGGMYADLLKTHSLNSSLPAIYSFHQPCDIVVPIDSNYVYWGLSWCLSNGYNCYGIANNKAMIYGARIFTKWNEVNKYGYVTQNEFTNATFPFSVLGSRGCLDQFNNPCHAYDNGQLRENNLAAFFSKMVTTSTDCVPNSVSYEEIKSENLIYIYPNPVENFISIEMIDKNTVVINATILDMSGKKVIEVKFDGRNIKTINTKNIQNGFYYLKLTDSNNNIFYRKFIKE